MIDLSEGALDAIMAGETVEGPIVQILGHKKLASSTSGERYRLLLSDGKRINSLTMLATQLNHMIDTELTEFAICKINRYAMSNVNNAGKPKRVMVILNIEVKTPGSEVGGKIGNPTQLDAQPETEQASAAPQSKPQAPPPSPKTSAAGFQRKRLDESVSAGSDITTTPIAALSPYQNRWVIKARVTNKPGIKTWSNSRGEGTLFSMDLVDESGEIRCTAFREQCDKFYNMIEIGKVYYISRCALKPANKQFSTLKNQYEMTMTNDTEVVACHDEVDDIPAISFDFQPLSEVETKEKNTVMDVLGIVKSYDDVQTLVARNTGRELRKRDVQLVDMSNVAVTLTLWGSQADDFSPVDNPVLAVKGARIGEFNGGKNLSTLQSSTLQLDPDLPEAHRLRGWYNTTGKEQECKFISKAGGGSLNAPLTTAFEAMNKCQQLTDGQETFMIKGCISLIRTENALYKSCPTEACKKKLVDQANGMYRCEKCDREFPNFKYRLLINLNVADWSGSFWATAFNDEAEKILGMSAEDIGILKENDSDTLDDVYTKPLFMPSFFKCRGKKEIYNDEVKVRSVINAAGPVDYKLYLNHLMDEIKRLANVDVNME
ncbi:replication protein A 70 kDa DNA-binding subunit isoform X2 [Venturia canescens]|uniref:replication protein A 70 kDa DNA-binding subunit isoform X2 n=1 Tax=Venturia canescens TaxID=32260 RepID=UPI001C9C2B75|nr:replication protein A 70 kDa DNA-binding subunit isoform X2 [Venturia canescens]